jgi:UDP-N-acetylmuramyl pentapeptide synthase
MEEVKKGLEEASSLPGRMEIIALAGGIHLINDTYNANPGSVGVAVENLVALKGNGRGILFMGDMLELGEHTEVAHKQIGVMAARAGLADLYATGEFAGHVADGAAGAGMDAKKIFTGTKEALVDALKDRLGTGDWILIKGSRLMAMDQVVERLRSEIGSEAKTNTNSR